MHAPARHDVFARFAFHARTRPTAPAVMWNDTVVTYGELLERCRSISAQLRRRGAGAETIVAVRMRRSDRLVAAMLGVLHAGAAYLPLDLSVPDERAGYMLESSGADIVLTDEGIEADFMNGGDAPHGGREPHPDQLAYVLYTSGSTGKPKGVQIGRGAFFNAVASFERILAAGHDDVFLSVTGISFDIFELELMLPLCTGGVLVLADRERLLEDGYLAGLAQRHGATLFQTTPTLARNLLDSGWRPHAALRLLIGGEALTPDLAERLQGAGGVFNVYGPTEATIWVSSDRVQSGRAPVIGSPLENTSLHVLDAALDEVPVEGQGELYLGGVQLARGYAGRPDLTADRFIPSPFAAGERLYRTGDVVKRNADGTLDYLGRADQQVKLRGYRIELGEIDAVIATQPGIASAVTVVREDKPGDPMLVTYYTADGAWLDRAPDAQLSAARTAAWEDIYDGRYAEEGDDAGHGDHSVWIDSRSGHTYSPAQMQEWIDTTVERVARFGARRILEIGCGSGQLLLRLADRVDGYVGTDVSAQALHALHRKTAHLPHVRLHHGPADRTCELAAAPFDLVVINSVVQYFPSSAYLLEVLRQARALLAPGGAIFVGDVRSRGLLDAFHAALEMGRSRDRHDAPRLARRVAARRKHDNELCLEPHFFTAARRSLGLGGVQLLSRRGEADTEMNAFRFDAVLREAAGPSGEIAEVRWNAGVWTAAHFDDLLVDRGAQPLRIDGVPDARTSLALSALQSGTHAARTQGLHPEGLLRLAERRGLQAFAGAPAEDGTFDMLVLPREARTQDFDFAPHGPARGEPATRPLLPDLLRQLEGDMRTEAARALPDYMVPALFVHLDRFPLNTSGKLDRNALPQPVIEAADATRLHDDAQAAIADSMAEVLGLPQRPGPQGDFFRLGGHSLAAVRFVARLRERFGSTFDLHAVFELRTVDALASRLREAGAIVERAQGLACGEYPAGTRVALSHAQRSLWFLDRLDGASALYNMPFAARIEGDLDVAALRRAIALVVQRHQALRTTYVEAQGVPEGIVNDTEAPELAVEECPQGLEARLADAARLPFDLGTDTPLRARLFRVDARTHVLLIVVHHIAADGLSMVVLSREIAAAYAGEPLAAPAAQYADFARWQRESVSDNEIESGLAWWRWHLQDVPDALELPTDRPRPPVAAHRGSCVHVAFGADLRAAVEALARAHDASAYAVLLSAFGILLGRLSNQNDVVVGVPAGGRALRAFEQTIGLFANVLPLRIDAARSVGVANFVQETSSALREALARQRVSFDQIVDHLGVARSLDRMPLVQAAFTYLDAPEELPLAGLRSDAIPLHLGTSRFDLSLQLAVSRDGGWRGMLEFDSDLFDDTTVARWAVHFEGLLRAMCDDATAIVRDLPLAGPRDFAPPLAESGTLDFVVEFERRCDEAPDALALVCGEERLTFAQLESRADRVAAALHADGVGIGDVVGIHLDRDTQLVAAIWGVLKAGAAFLPLDTSIPADRLQYMVSQAGARRVISESMESEVAAAAAIMRPADLLAGAAALPFRAVRAPRQALAYVIFTSGSTGVPKGVECTREGWSLFSRDVAQCMSIGRGDVGWSGASIAFDMFLSELLPLHGAGACVVMADRRQVLDVPYVAKLLADERVTHLIATPSMLSAWCTAGWTPRPGLRVTTGGEAIAPDLAERLSAQCELWNGYGPTEVTCAQAMGRLRAPFGVRASIGTAFGRNELFVLDMRLTPVPVGVVGELYIAGEQLARGYAGRADLTAERFMPSPFHDGQRMYRTGDLVRWRPDGQLEHCGRGDDQVKIRGYRLELGEIEGRLLACEGVASAAVIAREDSAGSKRLVAYVVPDAGVSLDARSIEAQLALHLPAYMVPSHFVPLARLPLTRNGKLDKKALPAPDWVAATTQDETATSVSSLEGQIAGLMAQVLGTDGCIGVDTHFFDAGGHSLAAVRLIADVRREFGVEIALRGFFEDPTPAGIARHVRAAGERQRERSPFVCFSKDAAGPVVFLVHGADGYAINFRHLGQELAPHVRLYGIDCAHAWLPESDSEGLGVRDLARLYVDRLLREFPNLDEFHVGGWSFGGLVALEMARCLRGRGLRVASAFAIDSAIHGAAQDVLGAIGAKVAIQDLARRNLLEAGHTREDVDRLFDPQSLPGAVGGLYAAFESHVAAAACFEPAPYDGDFTLVVASEGLAADAASQAQWRRIVQGELAMPQIEGGHLSILREPAVAGLASEITNCVLAGQLVEQ